MAGSSFIATPLTLEDTETLKRVLNSIIIQIDNILGNRDGNPLFIKNTPVGSIKDLDIGSKDLPDEIENIVNKINEIINILRQSNIINS